ncbi:11724_t:CDS:1, partial [Cetraspora pellucida]
KPENRPSAEILCEAFKKWQDDENILLELNESEINLENIEKLDEIIFSEGSKFFYYTNSIVDSGLQKLVLND